MANIMYDYNKTRLMYGLRKLAQEQNNKKEQPAPAQPEQPAPTEFEQSEPDDTFPKTNANPPTPSVFDQPAPSGQPASSEKPGPNYNFTQEQWAAARKRRALITAVAGTVGFGTGYLANQLISDDPTMTGGLLTGGVVGALAGGAGYALSDPQAYLKALADAEFRKNNPDAANGSNNKGDRSWGQRVDDFVDWIVQNPWAAAGGGLGIAAGVGTARHLGRRGLAVIPETLQKFKDLFHRNNGNAAAGTEPESPQQREKRIAEDTKKLNKERQRKYFKSRQAKQVDAIVDGLQKSKSSPEYRDAVINYNAANQAQKRLVKHDLRQIKALQEEQQPQQELKHQGATPKTQSRIQSTYANSGLAITSQSRTNINRALSNLKSDSAARKAITKQLQKSLNLPARDAYNIADGIVRSRAKGNTVDLNNIRLVPTKGGYVPYTSSKTNIGGAYRKGLKLLQ